MTGKRYDSQRRANAKYKREKTKVLSIRFFESDMALLDHVGRQGQKATYIKDLIRADMERGGGKGAGE